MKIEEQIDHHLNALPKEKGDELRLLFDIIRNEIPKAQLHFFDGKNAEGKVVANPTIGFGNCRLHYADGRHQDTFRLGISANSTGLSIHILGLKDKIFLTEFLGTRLGKVKITGYAIRCRRMSEIEEGVLRELVREVIKGNI